MNAAHDLPTTIPAYLERLRQSLQGCDPALAQDALYDAEDYLRSELAANPGKSEAATTASRASDTVPALSSLWNLRSRGSSMRGLRSRLERTLLSISI